MCGIAGLARADGVPVPRELIERMCAAQEHRGPDSRGIHVDGQAGLGIQRLRVIDLDSGDQPVYNEDGKIAVVLNGEIYNYAELRRELLRSGHRLATRGDTEVIAHLYEVLGTACLARLEGMFSFALWDARHRLLFIARDRLGKKPLFYCHRDGALSFASELGALLADGSIPRELDRDAIDAYLAYGYVPAPLSAFSAVRKLPPAHYLTYRDGALAVERYWRLDYSAKRELDPRELDGAIRDSLRAAVAKRLVSDVPLGAFLSGGIDSSAVVATMAELSSGPVKTFSIGFTDEPFNELPRARLVAERFATDHHELIVEPDAIEVLPQLVRHYGEPFGDHSALPCFYLAQLAREHVTVALNGDGGDECFAGYQRYTSNLLAARLEALPAAARNALARLASGGRTTDGTPLARARRFASRLGGDRRQRYLDQISVFDGAERRALYEPGFARQLTPGATEESVLGIWRRSSGAALLDQLLEIDTTAYLPGDLLTKIDVATMASSLEARSPLLDQRLVELAASIPPEQKATGTRRKIALKRALRGRLPDEVLDGPKRGFRLPVSRWLRTDLAPFARDVLLDRQHAERGWTRRAAVAELIDQHVSGQRDHGSRLWSLLALELWADAFLDPSSGLPARAPAADPVSAR